VNDTIQIASQAQTTATAVPSGAGGFFGTSGTGSNTLFANLLLQQMTTTGPASSSPSDLSPGGPGNGLFGPDNPGLSAFNLDDPGSQNLGLQNLGIQNPGAQGLDLQSLLSSGKLNSLLPLLNALKTQISGKGLPAGKELQSANASLNDQKSVPDAVLAAWLAALSAQQSQPDLKNLKIDPSLGGAPLLGGAMNVDPRVLNAIEQMISRLEQAGANGQQPAQPTAPPPEAVVPAAQDNQAVMAEPVAKAAANGKVEQNSFAALAQAAGGDPRVDKRTLAADAKTDPKPENIFSIKPAANDVRPTVPPVIPEGNVQQDHAGNANSQSQTSSQPQTGGRNSGNGDARKENSTADQFESLIASAQVSGSSSGSHVDQSGMASILQSAHGNTGNGPESSVVNTDKENVTSVRDVANASHLDPTTPRVVNEAQLMQAAGQAEMHVSLKSETAGSVDVRAMLEGNHISATIAAQHSGTRDWLNANISELHNSLSRDDLHLRAIEVTDSSLQNDPRNGGSSQQDAQPQQQQYMRPQVHSEFQRTAGLTDDLDLNQSETATQALSLHA